MGDGIIVRRARPGDIAAIAAIETESFPDPWSAEVFSEAMTYFGDMLFVATIRGEVVGFIAGGLEDTGEEVYGHICNLAVSRVCRKQGIGRMLVRREEHQFAIGMAIGVQLEVRVSNQAALDFYRRLGYQEAFGIASYYANGEDAIVMMKWFRF
ncbi:MAG: ribosomal protein S18-alanine N-acetyltransferase [Methanoregulaceae archaeon]|nr:ribosomal protein S18-alanine N-acetyltransferase [Methanoregulaceae archaeon]